MKLTCCISSPSRVQSRAKPKVANARQNHERNGSSNAAAGAPGLSQWQRVTNTFTAPSKTFEDIKRGNRSWWLPFIIMVVCSATSSLRAIYSKVACRQVVDNADTLDPKADRADGRRCRRSSGKRNMKISLYMHGGRFHRQSVFLFWPWLALCRLVLLGHHQFRIRRQGHLRQHLCRMDVCESA